MSVELRPPLEVDKGSVVRGLAASCSAACYFGDDLGDLPAFEALADMGRDEGMSTLSIAAVDDESDPSVAAAADVVVAGPPRGTRGSGLVGRGRRLGRPREGRGTAPGRPRRPRQLTGPAVGDGRTAPSVSGPRPAGPGASRRDGGT